MTIRVRILVSFLIPGMLLTGLAAGLFYLYSAINYRVDTVHSLTTTTRSRAGHIETYLTAMRGRMADFASDGLIQGCLSLLGGGAGISCTEDSLIQHLKINKLPAVQELERVSLVNTTGIVVASTEAAVLNQDMSGAQFMNTGRDRSMVFEPSGEAIDPIVYMVTAPVYYDKNFVGFVVGEFIPDVLYGILAGRTGLGNSGEIYIVNSEGLMASPSVYEPSTAYHQRINTESSQDCFRRGAGTGENADTEDLVNDDMYVYTNYRGVKVFSVQAYINSMKWCIVSEIETVETNASLRQLGWFLTGLGLALDMCILIIAYVLGRKISAPITKLEQGVEIIAQGHLEHRVGTKAPDEVGALSRAFDRMTVAIRKSHVRIDTLSDETRKSLEEDQEDK